MQRRCSACRRALPHTRSTNWRQACAAWRKWWALNRHPLEWVRLGECPTACRRCGERWSSPGAGEVARRCGLPEALESADLVITAEGRFDETSLGGKVVGHILTEAEDRAIVVAGAFATHCPTRSISLETRAGSSESARANARQWLKMAAARAARSTRVPHEDFPDESQGC